MVFASRSTGNFFILLVTFFALSACATLDPDYEEPTVMMTSFHAIPSDGALPAFEIGLRIINPNSSPLKLEGVVYSISLQGHELVKGAGNDYPQIEPYSEGDITLTASANLLKGIAFITTITRNQNEPLEYEFKAKLDVGGFFPALKISETGTFNLGN